MNRLRSMDLPFICIIFSYAQISFLCTHLRYAVLHASPLVLSTSLVSIPYLSSVAPPTPRLVALCHAYHLLKYSLFYFLCHFAALLFLDVYVHIWFYLDVDFAGIDNRIHRSSLLKYVLGLHDDNVARSWFSLYLFAERSLKLKRPQRLRG